MCCVLLMSRLRLIFVSVTHIYIWKLYLYASSMGKHLSGDSFCPTSARLRAGWYHTASADPFLTDGSWPSGFDARHSMLRSLHTAHEAICSWLVFIPMPVNRDALLCLLHNNNNNDDNDNNNNNDNDNGNSNSNSNSKSNSNNNNDNNNNNNVSADEDKRSVMRCMSGSLTRGGGETYPAFPVHAQPAIFRIW